MASSTLAPSAPEPQAPLFRFDRGEVTSNGGGGGWGVWSTTLLGSKHLSRTKSTSGFRSYTLEMRPRPAWSRQLGALFTEHELGIAESGLPHPLPLSATGFGASQVLPLLLQCVAAPANSLVIVEQPELHLQSRSTSEDR